MKDIRKILLMVGWEREEVSFRNENFLMPIEFGEELEYEAYKRWGYETIHTQSSPARRTKTTPSKQKNPTWPFNR